MPVDGDVVYECALRAHLVHELCFLQQALGRRWVACPGFTRASAGAAQCSAACAGGGLVLLGAWQRRRAVPRGRSGVLRYGEEREAVVRAAPMAGSTPLLDEAEQIGDNVAKHYDGFFRTLEARPVAVPREDVLLVYTANVSQGRLQLKGVFLSRHWTLPTPAFALETVGAALSAFVLYNTPAVTYAREIAGDCVSFDELIACLAMDSSQMAVFFRALMRAPAGVPHDADGRRTHAAAACLASVAHKGADLAAAPRLAAWLSSSLRDNNVPFDERVMLTRFAIALSPQTAERRVKAEQAALRDPRNDLPGNYALTSFDNIGFHVRAFGVTVVQFISSIQQLLSQSELASLQLVGDSAAVAKSTRRVDYEALDADAKAAVFDTSPSAARDLLADRALATYAHALHLCRLVPDGLFERDAKGTSFGYTLGDAGDCAAEPHAAGDDEMAATSNDAQAQPEGETATALHAQRLAAQGLAAESLEKLVTLWKASEDACGGGEEGDLVDEDEDEDGEEATAAPPSSSPQPPAAPTMFDVQIGTVSSLPMVHGNLAEASTLLHTVICPMLAAAKLPPYRPLSSWPAAAPTATDGAASGSGAQTTQLRPEHETPPAPYGQPWPMPADGSTPTFARTAQELFEQAGALFRGDGDPELKINKMRDKDPLLRHTVLPIDGGFHTLQAVEKSINIISWPVLETLLRDKDYRDTRGKREFFLSTSDPTQPLIEHEHMLLACIVEFAHQLLVVKPDASPADLHDYMLRRAATAPIVAKVVEYCRNVEVLLLLRDSERENNFRAYQLANAVALGNIFATTNCFNYVRNVCERMLRWAVASEADEVIYERLAFTMRTRWGKTIFCDRWFEHVQKVIRMGCGHAWSPTNHARIMRVGSNVQGFAASRMRNMRGGTRHGRAGSAPGVLCWHASWLAPSPGPPPGSGWAGSVAFRSAQRAMRKHCIAGGFDAQGAPTGEIGAPVMVSTRGKLRALGEREYVSLHDGSEKLCAEGLCCSVVGPERASAYTLRWYVNSRHELQREDETTMFSRLAQLDKPARQLAEFRHERHTTTDVTLIMTKKPIGNEHFMTVDYMQAELTKRGLTTTSKDKRTLADTLVQARRADAGAPPTRDEFLRRGGAPDSSVSRVAGAAEADGKLLVLRDGREIEPLASPLLALPGLRERPLARWLPPNAASSSAAPPPSSATMTGGASSAGASGRQTPPADASAAKRARRLTTPGLARQA